MATRLEDEELPVEANASDGLYFDKLMIGVDDRNEPEVGNINNWSQQRQ
jgi:hypothetical protein